MARALFTPEELAEMAAADAEIDKDGRSYSMYRETRHKYYLAHKEEINARSKAWAKANPERNRAASRRYYARHKEEILEKDRLYRQKNGDKIRAKQRELYHRKKEAEMKEGTTK